jgi:site-specific DNA recombinase
MEMTSKIKIGALYGRVSVDEAAEKGTSLESQEIIGLEFAKSLTERTGIKHSIKYKLIEQRGASGKDTNRPEYQKLLNLIRGRKIDFITAKEISRLSRSTLDFASLTDLCKQNNVAIYIRGLDLDPSSPMGEMLFKLLSVLAEFERKMIVSRVTESARARMLTQGHSNGGKTPLGFDLHATRKGFWTPNVEELQKVEEVFKIFVESGSLKYTLDETRRLRINSKSKKPFTYHSLGILLRNRAYIGQRMVTHGANNELKTDVQLPHGCVISKELFDEVQHKLEAQDSGKTVRTINSMRVYLLTGILFFQDGSAFCGQRGTSANGQRRFY